MIPWTFLRRLTAVTLVTVAALSPTTAHEYEELAPLGDALTLFLVELLEEGRSTGHLKGSFDRSSASQETAIRLELMVDTVSPNDMRWLEEVPRRELEHPALGRVPASQVLTLLSALAHALNHSGDDHDAPPQEANSDLSGIKERLEDLSKNYWGVESSTVESR
ncbi:MAG: hypothetical protein AAGG55_02810 [Pseudomonadota bacterium]